MNKSIIGVVAVLSFFMLQPAHASVTGVCSGCHVMHYSQVGMVPSALLAQGVGPQDYLLNNTCLGCHTGTNSGGGETPFVLTTGKADLTGALAGGNFFFSGSNIHYGHNPIELGVASIVTPPGWEPSGFPVGGNPVGDGSGTWTTNQLTCAGVWGCHGVHTESGVFGSHHNNPTGQLNTADSSGNSYRFLYKIKGFEDADWEFSKSATDHNVYFGQSRSSDTPESTTTISYFCAECHGIFHSGPANEGIASAGTTFFVDPWIRHPVDVSMPLTGEYAVYNSYNTDAPLASTSVPAASSSNVAAPGDRIVMCLSCHQAHATPYYAMLRWDYRGSGSGWTNGCATCHTAKS